MPTLFCFHFPPGSKIDVPIEFRNVVAALEALAKPSSLPQAWCKQLISSGKKDELVDLDASMQSSLGPEVGCLLRALAVAVEIEQPDDKKPAYITKEWDTKALIKAGILALTNLHAAEVDGPGIPEAKLLLSGKCGEALRKLAEKLLAAKSQHQKIFSDWSDVEKALVEKNDEETVRILKIYDTDDGEGISKKSIAG